MVSPPIGRPVKINHGQRAGKFLPSRHVFASTAAFDATFPAVVVKMSQVWMFCSRINKK
jgi:hypothetical protein